MKKIVLSAFALVLLSTAVVMTFVRPAVAEGTIYIRADGSVEGTTHISSADPITYIFTDNIYDEIVVERDNIVIDGASYTLQGTGSGRAIDLTGRSNVTIKNMEINSFWDGIWLNMSSSSIISGNNITNNWHGIQLYGSSNYNTIAGNNITANTYHGIYLLSSSYNSIYGNNVIENNDYGIRLHYSSNNVFRNNAARNNKRNFGVSGSLLSHYIQDIDDSNTVDGKPVYYWVNRQDMTAPPDAGWTALINCTCMTAKNLNLINNGQGVLLAFTTNSTITKNNITENSWYGIRLDYSSNNAISGNNITNNGGGIQLWNSSNNAISGNDITNDGGGIQLDCSSRYNTISGNNITENNWLGILLDESSNNSIYHNNFVNNSEQVFSDDSTNVWDDGYPSGGNYWSDYNGTDAYYGENATGPPPDGIGDTHYTVDANNTDRYPLMGMFSDFNATIEHNVQTICNSSISGFQFNGTAICFNVTGENGITGFCRICVPTALMNGTYQVFVNGTEVPHTLLPCSNTTHSYLYFTYEHSTQEIVIVPEFPTWTSVLLILVLLAVAIAIYKRRQLKTPIHKQSSSSFFSQCL